MIIMLTRTFTRGEYTHGYLTIDGNRICDTLENSTSCVPAGDYVITLLKCKQYSRKMPLLVPREVREVREVQEDHTSNLSTTSNSEAAQTIQTRCKTCKKSLRSQPSSLNFSLPCYCPQIKPGNGVHNRHDGSILVGQYICLGSLIHPKDFFDPLYERIRKAISRDTVVTLTVKDGNNLSNLSNSSSFSNL